MGCGGIPSKQQDAFQSGLRFERSVKHHFVIGEVAEERTYKVFIQPDRFQDSPYDYDELKSIVEGQLYRNGFREADGKEIPKYKVLISAYKSVTDQKNIQAKDQYFPSNIGIIEGSLGSGEDIYGKVYWDHHHGYGEFAAHDLSNDMAIEGYIHYSKDNAGQFFATTKIRDRIQGKVTPPNMDLQLEQMTMHLEGKDIGFRRFSADIITPIKAQTIFNTKGKNQKIFHLISIKIYPFYAKIGQSRDLLYSAAMLHQGKLKNPNHYNRSIIGKLFETFPGPTESQDLFFWNDRQNSLIHEAELK